MGTTPVYGLPYPALTDAPNGPSQIQALADSVETELQRIDGDVAALHVIYTVTYSGTTDASGFLTVTYSAPWTPVGGWYITTNPASSFAQPWGIDNITATSCRLRFANANGGALASAAAQGRLFLIN